MGKVVGLLVLLAALVVVAPARAEFVDNGTIYVDNDNIGNVSGGLSLDAAPEFDQPFGLAIHIDSTHNYGVGGTAYTPVTDSVVDSSGSNTTITTVYKVVSPALQITETITVPDTGNVFGVKYV